jgi:hypothetical protein
MAESSGESSNFPDASDILFQTLADWNDQLKHAGIELPAVPVEQPRPDKPDKPPKPKPRTRGYRPTPSASI